MLHTALSIRTRFTSIERFGVPSLALKRELEEDPVVAPYATALALLVNPAESIKNLKRLVKAGMYGRMGFYESLDYTRQEERRGGKGVIVYAYMAHHQGMSLDGHKQRAQPRHHAAALPCRSSESKTVEPLLFERIPPMPSMLVHRPSDQVAMRLLSGPSEPEYRVFDEDTPIPRVQLLGNGQYALMITNTGAGYSRWGELRYHALAFGLHPRQLGNVLLSSRGRKQHALVGDASALKRERPALHGDLQRRSRRVPAPHAGYRELIWK